MRNPWVTLAVGVALVTALVVAVASMEPQRTAPRTDPPRVTARQGSPGDGGSPGTDPAARMRNESRARLVALVQGSRARMPTGYDTVFVGMTVAQLRAARPSAVQGQPMADGRSAVWEERSPHGGRVVYLVAPSIQVVTQVQFMDRLPGPEGLLEDFRAMREKYGEPTGFWDCPESENASAIRRITWWGEAASVMEAILVYPGGVSVTRVVGATGDIAGALQRSRCAPVTQASLTQWPIATALRGERVPFANPR